MVGGDVTSSTPGESAKDTFFSRGGEVGSLSGTGGGVGSLSGTGGGVGSLSGTGGGVGSLSGMGGGVGSLGGEGGGGGVGSRCVLGGDVVLKGSNDISVSI